MEKTAAKQLSPLALAFLGDAVFELYVREKLLLQGNAPAQQLHRKAVGYVCARAQSKAVEEIAGLLSPDEESVYRRGRNAHSRPPKTRTWRITAGLPGWKPCSATCTCAGKRTGPGICFR